MPYVSQVKGSDNVIYDIRAKELVPSVRTEGNQIPYNYRVTNGGYVSDIGNREIDFLVGGTVAFNQLARDMTEIASSYSLDKWYVTSGTATVSSGVVTLTPTAQYGRINCFIPYKANHKLLVMGDIKLSNSSDADKVTLSVYSVDTSASGMAKCSATTEWQHLQAIYTYTSANPTANRVIITDTRTSNWGTIQAKNIVCIDLTQMFGSTIADYIYSLEQGTAGAGVAFFRSLFPNDYYAYNAGELMSVKTSAHKTVGFNLWDEKIIKNKCIASDGGITDHAGAILSENYIKAFPNVSYRFVCKSNVSGIAIGYYDENYTFISRNTAGGTTSFLTPANCRYIRFSIYVYGTDYIKSDYDNDICISIYNSNRLNDYEKYNGHNYPLASNLELRGIPKLDSNNKLYYDGDIYEYTGKVTRRYGYLNLGTLSWTYNSSGNYFNASIPSVRQHNNAVLGNDLCLKYILYTWNSWYNSRLDKTYGIGNDGRMYVTDSAYTDATAFKNSLNGVYLVYELATSTSESADPYVNPQICDPYGTEEYVDTRTVAIPVGHETSYYQYNDKEKLDSLPNSADTGDGVYLVTQTAGQMSLTAFSPNDKMDKDNPTGTGALSLNRKASTTVGFNSVAVGNNTTASGYVSYAEGTNTTASANYTHAEGSNTTASGEASHAEGYESKASGFYSHAENYFTIAAGMGSHTEGRYTAASHRSQHVFGEYNAIDPSTATATNKGNYVEIVGNGTSVSDRSNARTLDWSGNETIAGDLIFNGSTSLTEKFHLVDTASGSIASFNNGGDDIPVSEFECEIVAQQASGTPTPVNPLAITGFSQADITDRGKNLLENEATSGTVGTITFTVNADKSITVNGSTTTQRLFWFIPILVIMII